MFANPIECPPITLADGPSVRRLHCRRYRQCLNLADDRGWANFACHDCAIDEPMSREELAWDTDGLILCLAAAFERGEPIEMELRGYLTPRSALERPCARCGRREAKPLRTRCEECARFDRLDKRDRRAGVR